MMDDGLLVYDGVVLRKSDRRILESSSYLNDRVIEFYFSYLKWSYKTDDILFIPPSVSLSIASTSDPKSLKETIKPLKLEQKELIFFPIIDNDDTFLTHDGAGCHWSLLVYYRKLHSFIHHDSLGGINNLQARTLYEKMKKFVGIGGSRSRSNKGPSSKKRKRCCCSRSEACFTECLTRAQQTNQYDSGLYLMATADVICEWYTTWLVMKESLFWLSDLERRFSGCYVELSMRRDLLELLDMLVEE